MPPTIATGERPPRPDAVLIDAGLKVGKTSAKRVNSICDIAEPLLQCAEGEQVFVREMPLGAARIAGKLFVTRSRECSYYLPTGHPDEGAPAYAWEPGPQDGIKLGYLVEGATRHA